MGEVEPLRILHQKVEVLDQTLLPHVEQYVQLDALETVCEAITTLRVRGAPLLGLVGAAGMAIAADTLGCEDHQLRSAASRLRATRPTAADLGRAIDNSLALSLASPPSARSDILWAELTAFAARRLAEDDALARHGAAELLGHRRILTHCNTGALATGGIGTALGCIRRAFEQGAIDHVYATETRPLLQGARLTMWELARLGIPATLIVDSAAASLITARSVDAVITGADRVAANGDTANKIGTLGLALAANHAGIPFYIAAPLSTFDATAVSAEDIPIEKRPASEVVSFGGTLVAAAGSEAWNPAFDVTPAELITAIVTERGVARPPYSNALAALAELNP